MASIRPYILAAASLTVIVLFYLMREHWVHALGILPYAILLLCPLMHLFHGSHGRDHSGGKP